ncbi:hypothetical protein F1880_006532 [Penicillium rolfsii]|nr:hypothetical protein F1880_006532 [Penicillium rolfsii]
MHADRLVMAFTQSADYSIPIRAVNEVSYEDPHLAGDASTTTPSLGIALRGAPCHVRDVCPPNAVLKLRTSCVYSTMSGYVNIGSRMSVTMRARPAEMDSAEQRAIFVGQRHSRLSERPWTRLHYSEPRLTIYDGPVRAGLTFSAEGRRFLSIRNDFEDDQVLSAKGRIRRIPGTRGFWRDWAVDTGCVQLVEANTAAGMEDRDDLPCSSYASLWLSVLSPFSSAFVVHLQSLLHIDHVDHIPHRVGHPILRHSRRLHTFRHGPSQAPFRNPFLRRGSVGEEGDPNPRPLPQARVSCGCDVERTYKDP